MNKRFKTVKLESDPSAETPPVAKVDPIYCELLDAVQAIAWEMDPFSFRFSFVSPAAYEILGYPVVNWLNERRFWEEHLYPPDCETVLWSLSTMVSQAITSRDFDRPPFQLEYRMLAADGRVVWLKNYIKIVMGEEVRELLLQGLMLDITTQKLEENQLAEKAIFYQSLFETSPVVQLVTDLEAGRILEANSAACTLFGYSPSELNNYNVTVLFPPDSLHLVSECLKAVRSGQQFQKQGLNRRKDGTTFYSQVSGTFIIYHNKPHLLWSITDTTHQQLVLRETQLQLKAQEDRLNDRLEASNQLFSISELQPLAETIFRQVKEVLDYQGIILFVQQHDAEDEGPLEPVAQRLPFLDQQETSAYITCLICSGLVQKVVQQQRLFTSQDLQGALLLEWVRYFQLGKSSKYKYKNIWPFLAIPLVHQGRVNGVLFLVHNSPGYDRNEQLQQQIQKLCNQAALALENIRLIKRVRELARLEERNRLARELHDSTVQILCGIDLLVSAASKYQSRGEQEQVGPILNSISSLAEGGLEEMRTLLFDLQPEELATRGLVTVLNTLASTIYTRYKLEVITKISPQEPELKLEQKEGLYHIAREALYNVVKHARATQATLIFDCQPSSSGGGTTLKIYDNGRGFDPKQPKPGHLGLKNMQERATNLGGTLKIESTAGIGSSIEVHLPDCEPT